MSRVARAGRCLRTLIAWTACVASAGAGRAQNNTLNGNGVNFSNNALGLNSANGSVNGVRGNNATGVNNTSGLNNTSGVNNAMGLNDSSGANNSSGLNSSSGLGDAPINVPVNASTNASGIGTVNGTANGAANGAANGTAFGAGSVSDPSADPYAVGIDASASSVSSSSDPLAAPTPDAGVAAAPIAPAAADTTAAADPERTLHDERVAREVRQRLLNDLNIHCLDYCSILNVEALSEESFETANSDLGFEGSSDAAQRRFATRSARAEILVDTRFGGRNIDLLQQTFVKVTSRYPVALEIQWSRIEFPDNGMAMKSEAQVRADFALQVKNQLERIVSEFCPRECRVASVDVNVVRAGMDEVQSGSVFRYLFARDGKGALSVRGVTAAVSMNSEMGMERKDRIQALMREHLAPFGAVNLQVREIPFPKSIEELNAERGDPYGIERLGRMLKVFREYANTKEIIRERDTSRLESRASEKSLEAQRERERERAERTSNSSSSLSSEKASQERDRENSSTSRDNGESFWTQRNMLLVGGILLALVIVGALGLRAVVTGKRMQAVIHEGMQGAGFGAPVSLAPLGGGGAGEDRVAGLGAAGPGGGGFSPVPGVSLGMAAFPHTGSVLSDDIKARLEAQGLRDELIQTFMTQPKAARDVFGRILREDGIEHAARCVVIFGEVMIFELLGDADFKQDIATLAEYVHINAPQVPLGEQVEIMRRIKLKLTASKMRQMSAKTLDIFDFLKGRSAQQIYELIEDESPRSQSMVLTQLPTDKRRAVFELFEGTAKGDLLRELCNSGTVAREYLHNVADALKRKASQKASFTGENVQGTEVLLDLLERAELSEQQGLMYDLDATNPEAARVVRTRLVTVETLPYLRDGLLLEIFLSMDPTTMATFLAGTREHIRNLILSKAPSEIADDWAANLETIRSIDPEAMHLTEMQVLSKIRSFAASGLIHLLEINTALYPKNGEFGGSDSGGKTTRRIFKISNPMVA